MYKSVRVFKDRPLILKIAEDIKSQIDEFKPIMPTVKCLRNEVCKFTPAVEPLSSGL